MDSINFHNFENLFENSEPKSIDIYINSFSSFLFLKNSLFYNSLKLISKKKSFSNARILVVCDDNQFDSICDLFSSINNVYISNISSFSEQQENLITITINKKILYFFKINYDETKKTFNCNLYNVIFDELIYFFSIIYDILWCTVEKNKSLEKSNIFQQDFIDIASHQLRNPILPIIGFSKILKSKIKDSTVLEYIDIIIRNGEKLRDVANDILDISRIETNSIRVNKEFFDIDKILFDLINEYQDLAVRESVDIKFIYYGKPGLIIEADKSLIAQAFDNLLNNSYFSTKNNHGQEITISLSQKNTSSVTITVEDEGHQMQIKDLNQIFTKFFTKSIGGTGLGLFISKKLFDIHGGTVDIKNRSPDLGLKFTIDLPISNQKISSRSIGNKLYDNRILIIDESSENLHLIKNRIQDLGYGIDCYEDPLNAVQHFVPGKYSLVFLGVDIRGFDGFDLYDELKKRDNDVKGYFITSNKINKDAIDVFFDKDIQYDQFIYKPHLLDSIIKIIKNEHNR
ncbi:MAG: hybrid sensor histidine kinase/response regulator [Nitrosopumilus sp.]|nr:hybrid sensor histidine kinase/response regulator [Nitrosopumilus sp.]